MSQKKHIDWKKFSFWESVFTFFREFWPASELYFSTDLKQIDPAVLDYAATRLQAGFRGYMARKGH